MNKILKTRLGKLDRELKSELKVLVDLFFSSHPKNNTDVLGDEAKRQAMYKKYNKTAITITDTTVDLQFAIDELYFIMLHNK